MSKTTHTQQEQIPHMDENDHSHPILPILLVSVLGLALIALALRAFGII